MAISARVVLDSVSPGGVRLTTLEIEYPRFILAEFNTHRDFSRNSASSRAIPVEKMIERVESDPVIPMHWGRNQRGMVAEAELSPDEQARMRAEWLRSSREAVAAARRMAQIGGHKQVVNRILEPYLWMTSIVSSTRWANFFHQRCSPTAQPEIRLLAESIFAALRDSLARALEAGEFHTPYIQPDEFGLPVEDRKRISAARCARVSYLTHSGIRDHEKDLDLYSRLVRDQHPSPFEHVAEPVPGRHGNFKGWKQMRQSLEAEGAWSHESCVYCQFDD